MTSIDLYDELMKVPHWKPRTHLPIFKLTRPEIQDSRKLTRQRTNFKWRWKNVKDSSSIYEITTTTSGTWKTDSWIILGQTKRLVTPNLFRNMRTNQNKVRLKLLDHKGPSNQSDRHWQNGWESQDRIPIITWDFLQDIQEAAFGRRNRKDDQTNGTDPACGPKIFGGHAAQEDKAGDAGRY